MKKILMLTGGIALLLAGLFFLPQEQMLQSAVLPAPGMHCDNCAKTVTTALMKVEGVRRAEVSLSEKAAKVEFDAQKTRVEDLQAVIEGLGYAGESQDSATSAQMKECPDMGANCCADKTATPED